MTAGKDSLTVNLMDAEDSIDNPPLRIPDTIPERLDYMAESTNLLGEYTPPPVPEEIPEPEKAGLLTAATALSATDNPFVQPFLNPYNKSDLGNYDIMNLEITGDEEYNQFAEIEGTPYEYYAKEFVDATNPYLVAKTKRDIDMMLEAQKTFDSAVWYNQLGGGVLAVAANPINALAIVKAVAIGGGILKVGGRAAIANGSVEIINELLLNQTNPIRTVEESVTNVAAATVLGGVLGGALSKVSFSKQSLKNMAEGIKQTYTSLGDALPTILKRSDEAMAKDVANGDGLLNPLLERPPASLSSAGNPEVAAPYKVSQLDRLVEPFKPVSTGGAARLTSSLTPIARLVHSSFLSAQRLASKMFYYPGFRKFNAEGVPTPDNVETEVTKYYGALYRADEEGLKLLPEYKKEFSGDKASFYRAIGQSLLNLKQEGIAPVVKQASKAYKNIFDTVGQRAVDVGLISPESFAKYSTNGYFPIVPIKEKILANVNGFRDQLRIAIQRSFPERLAEDIAKVDAKFAKYSEDLRNKKTDRELQEEVDAVNAKIEEFVAKYGEDEFFINPASGEYRVGTGYDNELVEEESIIWRAAEAKYGDKFDPDLVEIPPLRVRDVDHLIKLKYMKAFRKLRYKYQIGGERWGEVVDTDTVKALARGEDIEYVDYDSFIEAEVDRYLNIFLGYDGRVVELGALKSTNPRFKERSLQYDPAGMGPFIELNVQKVANSYLRSVAPAIETKRLIGSTDLTSSIKEIEAERNLRVQGAKTNKERRAIEKEAKEIIRDITNLNDIITGKYLQKKNVDEAWVNASIIAKAYNYTVYMGNAALTQVAELGLGIMRYGILPYFKGGIYGNFVKNRLTGSNIRSSAMREIRLVGRVVNKYMASLMGESIDIVDPMARGTNLTRFAQWSADKFSKVNFIRSSLDIIQGINAQAAHHTIIDQMFRMAKTGNVPKNRSKRLLMASIGIDVEKAKTIVNNIKVFGAKDGGLWEVRSDLWDDPVAVRTWQTALATAVDQAALRRSAGTVPMWMNDTVGGVVGQFKAFIFESHEKIFLPSIQLRDANVVAGITVMIGLAMGVESLTRLAQGREQPKDLEELFYYALKRTSFAAILLSASSAYDVTGAYGLKEFLTGMKATPLDRENFIQGLIGPTFGTALNASVGVGAIVAKIRSGKNPTEAEWRALQRLVPTQNLIYFSYLFKEVRESLPTR